MSKVVYEAPVKAWSYELVLPQGLEDFLGEIGNAAEMDYERMKEV